MKRRHARGLVEVDRYKNQRLGADVAICLNKESGKFQAEYEGEIMFAATLGEIRSAVDSEVRDRVELPWVPIIHVTVHGSAHTFADILNDPMHGDETYQRKHDAVTGTLQIDAKRYWLAKRKDGVWVECEEWDSRDWQAEGLTPENAFLGPADRRINAHEFYPAKHRADFALPYTVKKEPYEGEGDEHYLPYDESLWQALNAIGDKMRDLHEQLKKMVGTVQGRKNLAAFVQRMLPTAKES